MPSAASLAQRPAALPEDKQATSDVGRASAGDHHVRAASTMARMPALSAAGSVSQRSTTRAQQASAPPHVVHDCAPGVLRQGRPSGDKALEVGICGANCTGLCSAWSFWRGRCTALGRRNTLSRIGDMCRSLGWFVRLLSGILEKGLVETQVLFYLGFAMISFSLKMAAPSILSDFMLDLP